MVTETADILIVGGGIVGFATALELQSRQPDARIVVLEKETGAGQHQSGHNSGVIHAGVYYPPKSMKAQFCREGVAATRAFCDAHNIPIDTCGKLIVATHTDELGRLADLGARARANGIPIEDIDATELRKREPHINGISALFSPTTGIVDFKRVTHVMAELFAARGGVIHYGHKVIKGVELDRSVSVTTDRTQFEANRVVTCAGLHADRIVRAFGYAPGFRIIPFRGEVFRLLNQPDDLVRHLIYPVPDPERPFLGVHLTRKIDGGFTVGPNAVLAFKREGYKRSDFSLKDTAGTIADTVFWKMIFNNFAPAMSEFSSSLSKRIFLRRVRRYCQQIQLKDLAHYPAGVRAQAVLDDGTIADDFIFIQGKRCLHVGNAPSPAATAAVPIGRYISDRLMALD